MLVLAGALVLGAATGAAASVAADAAPENAEEWLDLLEENASLPLHFEEAEALAAARDGLTPEAGATDARRSLLSRLSPHSRHPDSALHAMLLSEALAWSACTEERAAAGGEAWTRYGRLSETLPDSLLPPWEQARSFLLASALRDTPSCRAKLKIRAAAGIYREECRDPAAAPDASLKDPRFWSPACLRLRRPPAQACLVRSGEDCMVRAEDFDAAAADVPIPIGPLSESRAALLRTVLKQRFESGGVRASGAWRHGRPDSGKTDAPAPLRFRACSDSSRLASAAIPWLTAYRNELPRAWRAPRDSARAGDSSGLRKTRYGYFQIEEAPPGRSHEPLRTSERIEALKRAFGRRPALAERLARQAYSQGRMRERPDTLEFSLWLAGPAVDTQAYSPVAVRSVSAENAIDALAWKYFGMGKTDSVLGPFQVRYGAIRLKIHRKLRGAGAIPYPLAKALVLERAAQGMVIGSILGLWRQNPSEQPERRDPVQEKRASPFRNKRALAMALARLQSGPDPSEAHVSHLEKLPEAMLLERYASLRRERELGDWMDRLELTPEAERMDLRF